VQIGDNRAAEWVRRSNPVALGLLFSGLAGQVVTVLLYVTVSTRHGRREDNFSLISIF
jgi:hypothetical protein